MKQKIVIAGIGGVGGYFGGLIARNYAESKELETYFVARGQHLATIREKGLEVIKGDMRFLARPTLATHNPAQIGIADYLLICTKSYDLQEMLQALQPCVGPDTLIVPLLNGIEPAEQIRSFWPNSLVASGCTYIISSIVSPGVVENSGHRQYIFFGLEHRQHPRFNSLERLLRAAGIEATYSQDIATEVWKKFIFLSTIATATSYYDQLAGVLLQSQPAELRQLIDEVASLAEAKHIVLPDDIRSTTWAQLEKLPIDSSTSMHRDYLQGKPHTEVHTLTGYVVRESKRLGLKAPLFRKAYEALLFREQALYSSQ